MFVPAALPGVVLPFAVQNSNSSLVFVVLALGAMIFLIVKSFSGNGRDSAGPPAQPPRAKHAPYKHAVPARSKQHEPIRSSTTTVRTIKGRAYVIDGDTIIVAKTRIRLAGVDAPELDQPWGRKSKSAMIGICKGSIITVHLNGEQSYDREVGTAYLPDGRDIGAELIKQGLALDFERFSGGKYRHLEPAGVRRRITIWRRIDYQKSN